MDKLRLTIKASEETHRRQAKEAVTEIRNYIPRVIKSLQQLEEWLAKSEQENWLPVSIDTAVGGMEMEVLLSLRKSAAEKIASAEVYKHLQQISED